MSTISDNNSIREIRIESLKASIKDFALNISKDYFSFINDNVDTPLDCRLENGLPDPICLNNAFGDLINENLNDIDDWLELDSKLFPSFKNRNEAWDIIYQYLDYDEVEEIIFDVWNDYLSNIYGEDWNE